MRNSWPLRMERSLVALNIEVSSSHGALARVMAWAEHEMPVLVTEVGPSLLPDPSRTKALSAL